MHLNDRLASIQPERRGGSRTAFILAVALAAVALLGFGGGCALTGRTPPSVPHNIDGAHQDCRTCHERGEQGAPKVGHLIKEDCISCHRLLPPEQRK